MSTATAVPETYELEGDDALHTLRRTGWGRLARDAFDRFRAADGFSHSRALGYQFTLTALPGLIATVGLASALDQQTFKRVLQATLQDLAPGPASQIMSDAFQQGSDAASSSGESALIVGGIAAVLSGTLAMGQVERGANRIYGVERDRSTLKKYGRGFVLACSAGLLLLFAFLLLVAGPTIANAGKAAGGWSDSVVDLWSWVRWPGGIMLVVIAFSLLFKKSPKRNQPQPSWLATGAAVAVTLFSLFTAALAVYLTLSKSFGQTYGPLAGIIGILLWAHLASLALYLGLALTAQLEAVRAGVPAPSTGNERNE